MYYYSNLDVVAPPINKGSWTPVLSISLATWIISSREGVISPESPIISVEYQHKWFTLYNH